MMKDEKYVSEPKHRTSGGVSDRLAPEHALPSPMDALNIDPLVIEKQEQTDMIFGWNCV